MTRWILLLVLPAFALTACGESQEERQSAETEAASKEAGDAAAPSAEKTANDKARELFAGFFEENLKLNPLHATFIGDDRYNDRIANSISSEHREKALALHRDYLERARAIDESKLEGRTKLSWEIFVRERESDIKGFEFPSHLTPINQFYSMPNFMAQLGSGSSAQPFETVADYENWLSRMDDFTVWVDQAIGNMRRGMKEDVVQPEILMKRVIPQLEAHIVEDPAQSIFYRPVADMPEDFSDGERKRLTEAYITMISDKAVPTYRKLRDFIENEYLPETRQIVGMHALPMGEAWYRYLVRETTTTDMTPQEIHELGLSEVERIHGEMRQVMKQVGFEGTLDEFFEYTKTEDKFYPDSKEELLTAYENLRETLDKAAPKLFEIFPESEFEIRPVEPFREKSASGASYQSADPDGSRPGIFYVNTYDLSSRPLWATESLYLHEAVPGHHFQISIQQEMESLPKFRRFGGFTAYTEGWGLYAESLGKELGVYQDPYQYFGALNAELWRAIRLVVDTGLHYKGWSREDVLDYMYANSAVGEARAVSEAERYIAIPSQALAYKIGQLKIRELRDRAEKALGDDFDVKAFHSQVLNSGALPLNILERRIERWIEERKRAGAAGEAV